MQKYYYNDGANRFGPFTAEELLQKNITAETPVWYDGLANWCKAGEVEELKTILGLQQTAPAASITTAAVETASPVAEKVEEVTAGASAALPEKPAAAIQTDIPKAVKPENTSKKKGTAWISWVVALLAIGGAGYLVYQNMEDNKKDNTDNIASMSDSNSLNKHIEENTPPNSEADNTNTPGDSGTAINPAPVENPVDADPATPTVPVTVPSKNTKPGQPTSAKPVIAPAKDKQAEAQKAADKKAAEDKAKADAAQAALLASEKNTRNNWAKYITVGRLDYKIKDADDGGVDAFNVPVTNNSNAMLDKVTIRIDYWKKDKKVVQSETINVFNVPAGTIVNGKAAGYKKGNSAKAIITGISSRKLHFCYPGNSYTPDDPFYCN